MYICVSLCVENGMLRGSMDKSGAEAWSSKMSE